MAIDVDATSGKLVPSSGAQWGEVLARLSTPWHRYSGTPSGLSLVESINAKDGAWVPILGGFPVDTAPEFGKVVPGWTRTAYGYPTAGNFFDGGDWRNLAMAGPNMHDNGAGAGLLLIFAVGRQRISVTPTAARRMISWGGSNVNLVVGSAAGTDKKTRLMAGNIASPLTACVAASDTSYDDDVPHAFLIQARETGVNALEISLDTDVESLVATSAGAGSAFSNTETIQIFTAEQLGPDAVTPSVQNFDYFDIWIWRGVTPLTPDERVALLTTLKWRAGAIGPETAATFVLDLAVGGKVTYEWATDVHKSFSGKEKRVSLLGAPRQRFDFSAYLLDADDRAVRNALVVNAAQGEPFAIALPYEELELVADAAGKVLSVGSTTACDWALVGQKCAVRSPDRATIVETFVTAVSASTITVNDAPGVVGARGGSVAPLMPVYLEPELGFQRHPRELTMFSIKARAATFGFAGVDAMGVGASVTTHDGMPVLDRGHDLDGTSGDSIATAAEILDLGAIPLSVGNADAADFGRQVRLRGTRGGAADDFQWLKKFLYTVRGRQVSFLNPRWGVDFVYVSVPGAGQIRISGEFPTWFDAGLGDYLQLLKTDNSRQYVGVSGYADAGGGAWDLTLSASVTGTVVRVSLLERCRFDSDTIDVAWAGSVFVCETKARVVRQ